MFWFNGPAYPNKKINTGNMGILPQKLENKSSNLGVQPETVALGYWAPGLLASIPEYWLTP